jgi:hypothetical protein
MYTYSRLDRFFKVEETIFVFQTRSDVNVYNAAVVTLGRSIRSWSQSYDRELQRQRCKFLQRHGWEPSAF